MHVTVVLDPRTLWGSPPGPAADYCWESFWDHSQDEKKNVSLFYLDSFDLDWRSPEQSCAHHLKELVSIKKILKENTLVVVDDSPISGYLQESSEKKGNLDFVPFGLVPKPTISGKGSLIHQYAMQTGAKLLFSNYQTGWVGFD